MSELPEGWETVRAADLFEYVTSGSRGWATYCSSTGRAGFVRIGNLDHGTIDLDLRNLQRVTPPEDGEGTRTRLQPGDLLISITAELGMVAVVPQELGEAYINQHIALARPSARASPAFLGWFFASEGKKQLLELRRGATKAGLGLDDIRSVEVFIPSRAHQERIVAKLDSLQSKSRRAKDALDAIPPLLERFRQSVLAAAFRGDLTAGWRAKNPDVEPAPELLKRIRVERRRRWEEGELAKMRAKGEVPGDDRWKGKYVESAATDTEALGDLPVCWRKQTLGDLGEWTSGGTPSRSRADYFGGDIPWIKTGDLPDGPVVVVPERITEAGLRSSAAKRLPAGTLLVAMYGATIGKLGIVAVESATNQACAALLPDPGGPALLSYVFFYLLSERANLRRIGQGGAQPNISQGILKALTIPMPSLKEQELIVRNVETRLAAIERIERNVAEALRQGMQMDAAILSKAFRGELVTEDE